jgi:release factor glutamine methyltransferase
VTPASGSPPAASNRTFRDLLELGTRRLLSARGSAREDPHGEARRVLAAATSLPPSELVLRADEPAPWPVRARFLTMVARRAEGVPLQLLAGETGFHDVVLQVEAGVFVPRPETELLVEETLAALVALRGREPGRACAVLDLCTGSGAIAVAVAFADRALGSAVYAGDVDPHAVRLARTNAARCGVAVDVRRSDLFAGFAELAGDLDVVVCNPPYVAPSEVDRLPVEVVGFDPPRALFDPEGGIGFHRRLAAGGRVFLRPGGTLILEIGETQGDAVRGTLLAEGYEDVRVLADLAGRDRAVRGTREGKRPWTRSF